MLIQLDLLFQTGPNGASEEDWGVNYRALNDLFKISQSRGGSFNYEIQVQMVEIYNEQVHDLLLIDGSQKKYPFILGEGVLINIPPRSLPFSLVFISFIKYMRHTLSLSLFCFP
jgi:hypothetical protein